MAKTELGTKRLCPNCGTKYYDLNQDPVTCPRCGTVFGGPVERGRARPAAVNDDDDDDVVEAEGTAEFVSLEDADKEAATTGAATPATGDDEDEDEIDDKPDDTFLEEEEEDDDDVTDIIGDVDGDEET